MTTLRRRSWRHAVRIGGIAAAALAMLAPHSPSAARDNTKMIGLPVSEGRAQQIAHYNAICDSSR